MPISQAQQAAAGTRPGQEHGQDSNPEGPSPALEHLSLTGLHPASHQGVGHSPQQQPAP